MKRPGNAIRPCRTCSIKAERRADTRGSYYVPHTRYNYENQPLRQNLRLVINLVNQAADDGYRTKYGITRSSILLELRSIHFPRSFPADIMHCVLSNITPFLYRLWNSTKLKIDDPKTRGGYVDRFPELPSYRLRDTELRTIGSALTKSRSQIPVSIAHTPRRIDRDYTGFKAKEWEAWLLRFGTFLLDGILPNEYLANFRILGRLYSLATQYELTESDIPRIQELAEEFVRTYEKLYYRGEPERLQVCTVQIHYLLHYSDYIQDLGSARLFWQFFMERMNGIIKPKARSKSQMHASVSNGVLVAEHLNHLTFILSPDEPTSIDDTPLPRLSGIFNASLTTIQRARIEYAVDYRLGEPPFFKHCYLRNDLTIGSRKSQRRDDINRASHRICYHEPGIQEWQFGEVEFFIDAAGSGRWAYIKSFTNVNIDRGRRIATYNGTGTARWIRIEWIKSLIGVLHKGSTGSVDCIITDIDIFGQ